MGKEVRDIMILNTSQNYGDDGTGANNSSDPSDLLEGSIGIYDAKAGTLITAAAGLDNVQQVIIAIGTANEPLVSHPIDRRYIKKLSALAYAAPTMQVSYVGYNESGGDLNIASVSKGDAFSIKVIDTTKGAMPYPKDVFEYVAVTGDTEFDVCAGLCELANDESEPQYEQNVAAVYEVVGDGTAVTLTATETLDVTNGSKTVDTSGDLSGELSAGDFLRIKGVVYKIDAIDASSITLNIPYAGDTETGIAKGTGASQYAKYSADPTTFGIKITAEEYMIFRVAASGDLEDADLTQFNDDQGTAPDPGAGTYAQVNAIEKVALGYRGHRNRTYYPRNYPTYATSGNTYDMYNISWLNVFENKAHQGQVANPMSLTIAGIDGHTATDNAGSTFKTVFDELGDLVNQPVDEGVDTSE